MLCKKMYINSLKDLLFKKKKSTISLKDMGSVRELNSILNR